MWTKTKKGRWQHDPQQNTPYAVKKEVAWPERWWPGVQSSSLFSCHFLKPQLLLNRSWGPHMSKRHLGIRSRSQMVWLAQLNVYCLTGGRTEGNRLSQSDSDDSLIPLLLAPCKHICYSRSARAHTYNMFPQHTHSHLCTPCSSTLGISEHGVVG